MFHIEGLTLAVQMFVGLKLQDLGQRIAVLRGVEVSPRARAGRLQKETEGQGQGKGKGKEERKKEKRKKKKGKGEG